MAVQILLITSIGLAAAACCLVFWLMIYRPAERIIVPVADPHDGAVSDFMSAVSKWEHGRA
jgi:hypothetical protein